jgi:hypothetical protein
MKCFALAFLVTGCLLAEPAAAGISGGSNFSMGGASPPICSFAAAPRALNAENMSLSGAGQTSASLSINQLTDSATALLKKASIQLEIIGICNESHYLSLKTSKGGLTLEDQTAVTGGNFLNHVNYRVQADWAGQSISLNTDAIAEKEVSTAVIEKTHRGALNISLLIDENANDMNKPVLAGQYTDFLTVQIGLPF